MPTTSPAIWFARQAVGPSITRFWEPHVHSFFRANIWVVSGRDGDLVIDFGMGLRPLRPELRRDDGKPLHAIATHVHVDHVGSFHEFEERAGHHLEADGFASMDDGHTLAHLFRSLDGAVAAPPQPGWRPTEFRLRQARLTRLLGEGDEVDVGNHRFEVLHLPGHSPGSIALWEPAKRILFSGDAIYAGTLVDDLPGSDVLAYVDTMGRLAGLQADTVYPGHNAPLDGEEMRRIARRYADDARRKRDRGPGVGDSRAP